MRKLLLLIAVLSAFGSSGVAQQPDSAAPATHAEGVRVTFIPPPMEGTISLGVYDRAGKLVRVLKREATEKEFTVGLNGFITTWDGRDDAGAEVPAGTYDLRGYSVAALEVEGIAYHCNDWVTGDESPRIKRVLPGGEFISPGSAKSNVQLVDGRNGQVTLSSQPSDGQVAPITFTQDNEANNEPPPEGLPPGAKSLIRVKSELFTHAEGGIWRKKSPGDWAKYELPGIRRAVHLCAGEDTLWVIDSAPESTTVKEYSPAGELLREMQTGAGEPTPVWMTARGRDEIALLEENAREQRVRILSRAPGGDEGGAEVGTSTWRTLVSRSILRSETFAQVANALDRPERVVPDDQITVRLLPNPLYKDASAEIALRVAFDKSGALLESGDGLPLVGLTETPHLRWVAMHREKGSKALTVFQSDGAVVEEFRVGKLANMMVFDAGDCDWPPARSKK
jgi:hypothetical protein